MIIWASVGLGIVFSENIILSDTESLGYHELKQHKPWYDEELPNY
jgi:hypothetical protein